MEDFHKDDEFAQFIFTQYFKSQNLSNEEALHEVTKSFRDYLLAMEAFKLQAVTTLL